MSEGSDVIDKWAHEIIPLLEQLKLSSTNALNISLFKLNSILSEENEKLDDNQKELILFTILSTYTRYPFDSKFNKLVLQSFKNFINIDSEKYSKIILAFIVKQSTKPIAIRDLLVLINWNNYVLNLVFEKENFQSLLKVSISALVSLISILSEYTEIEGKKNHYLRAIASFKFDVVSLFANLLKKDENLISNLLEYICIDKFPVSGVIITIGLLSTASVSNKSALKILKNKESEVVDFFVKTCLSTKINPNKLSLELFCDFIKFVLTEESLETKLIPGLEKLSLRNSELTFAVFSPSIFAFLNYESIDIVTLLSKTKFFTQLFSSLKASKESVRIGASKTLSIVLSHNQINENDGESILPYIDELFKVLKGLSSSAIEQKNLIFNVLNSVPITLTLASKKILELTIPYVTKETNEVVLSQLLNILLSHFVYLVTLKDEFDLKSKIIELLINGIKEKKQPLRTSWITSFSAAILDVKINKENESEIIELFNSGITDLLLKTFDECMTSPLPSINNKLISAGYSAIATLFQLCESFENDDLSKKLNDFNVVEKSIEETETKMSCFTNLKIVTKLITKESQEWYVRSLFSLSRHLTEESTLFGSAILYATISRNFAPSSRLLANQLLHKYYEVNQKVIGFSLTNAINLLIKEVEFNPDFNYEFKYLLPTISSTIHQFNSCDLSLLESQLVNLLIPFEHKILKDIVNGWVSLCQKCHVDPGKIVAKYSKEIVSQISEILADPSDDIFKNDIFSAACQTTSIISFFSPGSIVPLLSEIIEADLSIVSHLDHDDSKLKIWKGVDGEMVIDVLESKTSVNIAKSKDAENLKWEQSVRKELEAKKKITKKLNKEEQIKVNEQLELEKAIRQKINGQYLKLRRGLEIIISLSKQAKSVDNGTNIWFPVAISNILELLNSKAAIQLTGALASECFLTLSDVVATDSLSGSSSMKYVGSSTLRLHSVDCIPAEFTGKPLDELLASQLFSLKLCSDKSLFNNLTLMYVLPLLVKVIENGKNYIIKNGKKVFKVNTEFSEDAAEEEQLTLALEIISSNSELFEDSTIPRTSILTHLIELLALSSKAKIAKECFVSLCQNISLNISDSDMSIILKSLINPNVFVRATILEALDQEFDLTDLDFNEELWISCFDNVTNNKEIAETIWSESGFVLTNDVPTKLIPYLGNTDNGVRLSIAKSLASSIIQIGSSELFISTLDNLLELFRIMSKPPTPETDEFGLIIKNTTNQKDRWEQRSGVALTLVHLASMFSSSTEVSKVFTFLIKERALGDKELIVRSELQDAGLKIIENNGKANVEILITIFESCLEEKDEKSKIQDMVKESVIILYGSLARHLDSTDKRIDSIVNRLLESLDTPSEDVQYAVSECISPLVPFIQNKLSGYIDNLFEKLFSTKSLAIRRGAAYGIAGLAKGVGIKALCEYDIIRNLTEASDDKKDNQKRESVLFAFECISQSFGALFEPYVIEILPIVLKSFGDSSAEVREATDYAARIIMKNTTSYGIKKMIPLAIGNLDDFAWRTKKGSVELLGSMAYLDPAQLSSSLPNIVPEIVGVLNDSHKEVRKAADAALKKFGEVIRNPEIQELVPILLKAIGDPTKYTSDALDSLITTQFVHYIDGPSLALIIRVINRGMQDRSANTKKKACQIVGNMAILVDTHDLMPYLSQLINELNEAVVDPVPQTRATAARALGSLVEKLGEEKFPGLISNLLAALKDEEKPGNRLGSAQALAEIISGLGISKLEEMLPIIINGTTSSKSFVREGFMPLLLFLPVCFGSQFAPYLSKTIPPILAGLADPVEEIRDVSLRTGRLIVNNYAKKAVDLLLPELEKGLSDYNARIRLSSVELTGELLFKISGISGKQELADDVSLSKNVAKAFHEVLGDERRNTVLSALFVCRSDVSGAVRATASNIWKALVANTPKTIKEIMPTLINIIIRRLASPDDIQRNIVASTLGDMIRRVGGNALGQILPTLKETMVSSDSDAKQGICIAIYEIITSTATDNVIEHQDVFVSIIKEALVDPIPSVREAAAQAFDSLQESIGSSAVDEVIPQLLEMLNSSDGSEDALCALQEIMSTKSDVIFPILIPSLLTPPINGRAIGALAQAAGRALYKRLSSIINALVDGIANELGDKEELYDALTKTLISVDSDEGCHPLLQQVLSLMKHEDIKKKNIILDVLPEFFKESNLDYSIYTEDLVIQCIYLLNNEDEELAKKAFETLSVIVKKQSKQMLEKLVIPAQQTLSYIQTDSKEIYAFTLPRGPGCILPVFLHGLMYGNPQQREVSANGISIIIDNTPASGLKPFVTTIVGPLIRVIGERFSSDIKSAILLALNKLFTKIPQFLFPFIPQLQRTFIKSLSDPSNELLRTRAAKALGTLIKYQPKVDPLVTELLNNAKAVDASNIAIKTAILKALLEVVDKAGDKMSEASKNGIMVLVEQEMFNEGAGVNAAVAYAKLVGALSKILTQTELTNMLKNKIMSADLEYENSSRFAILTLNAFIKDSAESILNCGLLDEIADFIIATSSSKNSYVTDNSTIAIGKLLLSLDKLENIEDAPVRRFVEQLCISMTNPTSNSPDTRRLALVVARTISRYQYDTAVIPNLDLLIPSVFACVRDPILPVKLAGEKAILAILDLVDNESNTNFNNWVTSLGTAQTVNTASGTVLQLRSITEYVKRVATRLANVERERICAGGDKEAMFSDQFEDESEIWAIGGVDLSEE
jgi:HEAT repeat protein